VTGAASEVTTLQRDTSVHIIIIITFLTLGRYDPEEVLKITDKQKGYDQSAGAVIIIIIISQKPMNGVSPNFGHRCIWLHRCAD